MTNRTARPRAPKAGTTGFDAWLEAHRVRTIDSRLDDLSGLERPKKAIEALAYSLLHPDEIRAAGGSVPAAILITGPVGCGKTSLARALAGIVAERVVFIEVVAAELTPGRVASIVRHAEQSSEPVVVFLDEISWLGLGRGSRQHDAASRAALFAVLAAISGLRDPGLAPIMWLGATSDDPDNLDEALTRAGRFSRVIEVRRPGPATRRAHFERLLGKRRTAGVFDLDRLVDLTVGRSFADLDQAVDDALVLALAECGPAGGINQPHLEFAISAAGRTDDEPEVDPGDRAHASGHEAAHAICAKVLEGGKIEPSRIRAISLLGHRGAQTSLESEAASSAPMSDADLRRRICVLVAGAAGERILFPEAGASTGCADDAQQAGNLLMRRISSGIDPEWAAAWPSWLDLGPAHADRRTAAMDAILAEEVARATSILRAHRHGLELLASRILSAGDLAGSELRAALDDALGATEPADEVQAPEG